MDSANQTAISSSDKAVAGASVAPWMLPEIQILEVAIATAIFIVIRSLRQKRRHGLPVWPVVGMLPSLAAGIRTDMYEWISDVISSQNGTFIFRGPWLSNLNCVVTADPRNLEYLLKTKFSSFPKGDYFRSTVRDLLGDGIFSADDETWQKQRKTASLEFHSAGFRAMTADSLVQLVHSRLLPVLEESLEKKEAMNLQDVLLRLTFDNVCMIAFGVDPGCLHPGLPEIPFARAFEDATEATVFRFVTPTALWRALRYFDVGIEKKLRKSIMRVDEFADEVIRTRRKELELDASSGNPSSRSDLLTVFMKLKDDDGQPFSPRFLRDICVNFILAGRDTSSVALSWFFWLLDRHPAVEERILEEIRRIIGERKKEHSSGEAEETEESSLRLKNHFSRLIFKPEEVKKMEYLQAALSESLRLYPSVPVDHKEVNEDEVFPDGTKLKKGTKVIYAIYTMGRMESIWGKDCREFKPERWLRDGKFMSESAYKFTAFNGGPRLCLGKDFAYYQMKFVAASIIYRYRVKVVENFPVSPKLSLTMYMKNGLKVNIYRRDEFDMKRNEMLGS